MLSLDADNPVVVTSGVRPSANARQPVATFIEAVVIGPGDSNRLLIFGGSAIVNIENALEDQTIGTVGTAQVEIVLAKNLADASDFRGSATYAAPSVVSNDDQPDYAYSVVAARTVVRPDGSLRLLASIQVEDDSSVVRFSYQASVLAHVE